MHILALTGNFYPEIKSPSACVKPYLLELARENEVEVICPVSNSHFRESILVEGIKFHFVSNWLNDRYINATTCIREGNGSLLHRLISRFVNVLNYMKEEFFPTPFDSSWLRVYLDKLNEIQKGNKIDVLVSVTYPFYTHVVALKFKSLHPSVKWLTYTTDPLAYNEANPIAPWKKKNAMDIEKKVYDACDKCIVTEELCDNLTNDYKITKEKILVLPYLVETEKISRECTENNTGRTQVLYAGGLFYRVRDPQTMLNVFSKLKSVDLNLYVSGDRKCRKILKTVYSSNVHINGLVTREEYFKLLSRADILINLSNNAKLQAPHKLMELVSTGKPIINFYYHKNAGFNIIEKYPLGINIPNACNINEMTTRIDDFIADNRFKRLSEADIREIYHDYLLSNQMKSIMDVILN